MLIGATRLLLTGRLRRARALILVVTAVFIGIAAGAGLRWPTVHHAAFGNGSAQRGLAVGARLTRWEAVAAFILNLGWWTGWGRITAHRPVGGRSHLPR